MSKILFIDIDGTLVDYFGNLPESAITAIRKARANGHKVYLCTGRSRAEIYSEIWGIGVDGLIGGKGNEHATSMTVRKAFPDMIFGQKPVRDDVNKISYVLHSYADYLETASRFPNLKNGTWGGKGEEALFGDVGVSNVSKAFAVETLLAHIGGELQDTIAFGDADIDIPMFACCNESVCMGNGGKVAKEAADLITDPVDQDGLYKAFEKLGLI